MQLTGIDDFITFPTSNTLISGRLSRPKSWRQHYRKVKIYIFRCSLFGLAQALAPCSSAFFTVSDNWFPMKILVSHSMKTGWQRLLTFAWLSSSRRMSSIFKSPWITPADCNDSLTKTTSTVTTNRPDFVSFLMKLKKNRRCNLKRNCLNIS